MHNIIPVSSPADNPADAILQQIALAEYQKRLAADVASEPETKADSLSEQACPTLAYVSVGSLTPKWDNSPSGQLALLLGLSPPDDRLVCSRTLRFLLSKGCKGVVSWLPCKSWSCRACFARNIWNRASHYATLLLGTDEALCVCRVGAAGWSKARKALWRARASYVATVPGFGLRTVLSTAVDVPGARLVTASEAVGQLGAGLRLLHRPERREDNSRYRPILSSYSWSLPKRESGSWTLIGIARTGNPEAIVEALANHGIKARIRRGTSVSEPVVSWSTPAQWSEDHRKSLDEELARVLSRAG
jgi:hypothetical protein